MNNSITYYKMKSPYEGDITKNCALTGPEVDNNFFVLEGRDVKSISVEDFDIVLNLVNGENLKAKDVFNNFLTDISFDKENGILTIHHNDGTVETIDGFKSGDNVTIVENNTNGLLKIASDDTLKGDGTIAQPLSVAATYRTGQFRPVNEIIETDITDKCNHHHNDKCLTAGDRFVVSETISPYGLLYDYHAVEHIACELAKSHSGWRIPTKEDWDDMLNAIEPCEEDKNHNEQMPNKYLGKWAAKLLKTRDYWKESSVCHCENEEDDHCHCGKGHTCKPSYCGEYDTCHFKCNKDFTKGVDKYGFSIIPAGYADDGKNILYFGERANFWTATNIQRENIFVKRFEYSKNKVHQDVIAAQNHLSLRLIKDYQDNNYKEIDRILGQTYPTVLMPSVEKGKTIWTAINVYYSKNCHYLVPNNGEDMSFGKRYFIDEWNGHRWVRNEMNEGDSVVVKHAPDDQTDVEYRIINGELIPIESTIYNKVKEDIDRLEQNLDGKLSESKSDLEEKISAEAEKREKEDAKISKTLADFGAETNKAFEIINNVIKTSVDNINNAIQTTNTVLNNSVSDLQSKISKETEERVKKDEELTVVDRNLQNGIDEIKDELGISTGKRTYVRYTDVPSADNPDRRAIVLKNHDIILGTDTEGNTYNLAMLSKWDVADYGSGKIHFNINSIDRPTVNDDKDKQVAYLSDINQASSKIEESINEVNDKLAEETAERIKKDADIEGLIYDSISKLTESMATVEGQLIEKDGTTFDNQSGILTLKHKDDKLNEDIQINMSMNFGNF